jgi:hypothetical protein
MDVSKMVDVIQERHGVTLDPGDSIFLLGTLAAELNKESREEFARIAGELSDQVAAALVLADTTAKARSERLITEAAKWSAEHIRDAGAEVIEQMDLRFAQSQQSAKASKIAAIVVTASAGLMILLEMIRI